MTPLIGAKITAYAISCTIHEVTLFSLKGNYWNRNSNTKKELLRSMIINFKENKKGAMNKITAFLKGLCQDSP